MTPLTISQCCVKNMCVTIVGEKWSIGNTLNKIYHLLAPFMKDDGFKLRPIWKNAKIGITM
jgi:hypothetical protein